MGYIMGALPGMCIIGVVVWIAATIATVAMVGADLNDIATNGYDEND